MGDSGLTVYVGIVAVGVIVASLIMALIAWRVPRRSLRIGLGTGIMALAEEPPRRRRSQHVASR